MTLLFLARVQTDLGTLNQIRIATSGEAETGNKGETFRGLRAIQSLSGTQWFRTY